MSAAVVVVLVLDMPIGQCTVRYYRALLSVHSSFIAANWDACV